MELSVESSFQYVTWKVQDFFELPSEIGYSLDSPEIRFAGDSYCLRLYPKGRVEYEDEVWTELELVKLTSTFPERSVSCKVGYRERDEEEEVDTYCSSLTNKLFLKRSSLQKDRDMCVPDGTFTALCSMRLIEPSSPVIPHSEEYKDSDTKEEQEGLQGQSVFFSLHLWPLKMELSIESPCQYVTWKVPDFFQLLSKIGYSLNSPDFCFAGDRYCLRFYPKEDRNANKSDTDLQLVRLTSTFPERIVLYKVGYRIRNILGCDFDQYSYSGTLIDGFGFCLSRSQLEKDQDEFVQDGTLTVFCLVRLKQSGTGSPRSEEAGNSHAEEKQEILPDVTLLSERMEYLLKKGNDYDLTICVQDKEFRAHRIILSARSPVFAMMLSNDTKENNKGTINIEDCDPDSFDDFLLYVYSGRTENLTPSRALHIYYTADKYGFSALKKRCVRVLKTSLSVTSICDVILLAAKHGEKELLEVASEFFIQNIDEILITVGWQRFLSENPVEANELYIKSIQFFRQKK